MRILGNNVLLLRMIYESVIPSQLKHLSHILHIHQKGLQSHGALYAGQLQQVFR